MTQKPSVGVAEASPPVLTVECARATIRLNRPRHLNRLQPGDLNVLLQLFDQIENDTTLRVVVLTGTGRAFSDGYDLTSIAERARSEQEQIAGNTFETVVNRLEDLADVLVRVRVVVHGGERRERGGGTQLPLPLAGEVESAKPTG